MTRFKVIDNRTSLAKKIKDMERNLSNFSDYFFEEMAQTVIDYSPVDTGTYITSHNYQVGRTGTTIGNSSHKKPRGQPRGPFAAKGLQKLLGQIPNVVGAGLSNVTLYNNAVHSKQVETKHGYAPYGRTRSQLSRIAASAAARAGG